jgi:hypothetical protein
LFDPRRPARAALTALACVLFATAGADGALAADLTHPQTPGPLSDESTLTRWTTALSKAAIRERPAAAAPAVARLRYFTEDRLPEVYVALEQAYGADGRTWVRVRVPMRPNGTTGWVPRAALNGWQTARGSLWISRTRRVAVLLRGGRAVWRARVGVGKPGTPTPAGSFYVRERIRNLGGAGAYGPIAFGTSAYSRLSDWPGGGVIGIHGTDQPGLIPGAVSHGCVRVPNRAIRRLARLLTVGTPVRIVDGAVG